MTLLLSLERSELVINGSKYHFIDLSRLLSLEQLQQMPYSLRILLENVALRSPETLHGFLRMLSGEAAYEEVAFIPIV